MLRPGEDGGGIAKRTASPLAELGVAAHRELELGAVRLHGVRASDRGADGPAQEQVVRQHEVGREVLAHGGRARLHEALALGPAEILDASSLHVLVAVDDEHRQEPAHIGPDHLCPADVVPIGMRILAEDDDLVPEARPGAREAARVHIRSGAAQEIAVPDENLHHCES